MTDDAVRVDSFSPSHTGSTESANPVPFALSGLLEQTAAMHRHLCPRQVLGVRIGLLAGQTLGLELPREDKRLLALVETDGCFADGVSVATGCWVGHRTLRLIDHGKIAATFVDTRTGSSLRITPVVQARALARERAPAGMGKWRAYLEGYQTIPDDELFTVRHVQLSFSLEELLSTPRARAVCQACLEEIVNGREVVQDSRVLCRSCAGESYWQAST